MLAFSKKLEISIKAPDKAATSTTFVKIYYMYYSFGDCDRIFYPVSAPRLLQDEAV